MRRLLVIAIALGPALFAAQPDDGIPLEKLGAMLEAARLVEQANGGTTVDLMELINAGDAAVSDQLDPYSGLLDTDAYRRARIHHRGEFVGIGVNYQYRHDHLLIRSVFPDGPAAVAGMRPGDHLIAVEAAPVASLGRSETINQLRGSVGSQVTVTIRRHGETRQLTITRDRIALPAVTDAKLLDDAVGFVRLTKFHGTAEAQLTRELEALRKAGMRSLILDLRDNPGGATDAAIRIAGLFLKRGTIVASVSENDADPEPIRTRNHNRRLATIPMVCLVNGASASSAEILAAALGDHARATLVGQTTFGKGIGQETTRLIDGSAIKLTNTEYFRPNGTPIHKRGITPHVIVNSRNEAAWLAAARQSLTTNHLAPK